MSKLRNEISFPRTGMSKGVDPRNLKENEYTHALNVNLDSTDGDFIDLTFEKSNRLSAKFPEGFKVIGKFNRLLKNFTYYFLHNPETKNNLFGYIDNSVEFKDISDTLNEEGSIIDSPLEEQNQETFKNFTILLDDSCKVNKTQGFNFHIEYPIKNPLLKEQKTGGVIYFTDFYNKPRHIELDNIEKYFIQEQACEEDIVTGCPDFNKMLIHKESQLPIIESTTVTNGGSLQKGTYSFLIALTDALGNEVSEYYSLTQPTDIWERGDETVSSKAIKLKIDSIDEEYTHYRIVIIFTDKDSRSTTAYDAGQFSTNNKEVIITDISTYQRISLEKISFVNQKVLKSEGLTTANNSLMEYGLVFERELNLQPVVNLMGSYLEWQTHVATEDLYTYGDMRSKYLGINRNEIVPYGIRFLKTGGTPTAVFPLVGREAKPSDRQLVSEQDINRQSFDDTDTCDTTIRNQRWQYFNTATVTGGCGSSQNSIEVITEQFGDCISNGVRTLPAGSIQLTDDDVIDNLVSYVEDHIEGCTGGLAGTGICEALTQSYPNSACQVTFDEECDSPEKISEQPYIENTVGERIEYDYITTTGAYSPASNSLSIYNPFKMEGGQYIPNNTVAGTTIYERKDNASNNNTYLTAQNSQENLLSFASNFVIIDCNDRDSLSTNGFTSSGSLDGGRFVNKVNDNSQWFFVDTSVGRYITITNTLVEPNPNETLPAENFQYSTTQRVSFYREGQTVAFHSFLINSNLNEAFLIYKNNGVLKIKRGNTETSFNVTSNNVYFSVEQGVTAISDTKCIKHATRGAYQIYSEDLKYTARRLAYDSITIGVKIRYKSLCRTYEPVITSCNVAPHQKGEFSYHESTLLYPDNPELFDSTNLVVKQDRIPAEMKAEFITKFVSGAGNNQDYVIKNSFDLTCQPIRHFKFPDNNIAPFMTDVPLAQFGESYIYPLGVTINEKAINILLDIALDSNLINAEERESIYGYEIFRGNLATNRSVVSSGLLYDTRQYDEDGKTVYYPNYPYNSYGADVVNQISVPSGFGTKGSNFTFHSPETDYSTNSVGATELAIQGYQFGKSKGYFDEVEEHPKWIILSRKAYNTASTLATIEVTAESLIAAAQAAAGVDALWIVGGVGSSGTNAGGTVAQYALAAAVGTIVAAQGILYKYGRYKMQWLETFRNLGVGNNFASYYFSEGHYNYLQTLTDNQNSVRSLQTIKSVKDGRLSITNRVTKEKIDVNNIDREWSTFIMLGNKTPINYPNYYSSFDRDSITYQSLEGIDTSGRSREIVKNIASPYVHLINYNPALHGQIDSISWITTSYKGDLLSPKTTCLPIFGGDTFISRHTLKRKIPMFLTTAMGQSNTTPFEYKFYNNIGRNPKFFINYNVDSEYSKRGSAYPELKSDYSLDNMTDKRFYVISPSKFYMYYYGVPSFLTETRINTNYRESGNGDAENFYPNVGDLGRWTQERNVKLRTPNFYKYSQTYSGQANVFNSRTLSSNFTQQQQSIVESATNGVIFSLPDINENSQADSWLRFRPLDFYEFDSKYGKLKELKGIENEAILARFEHTSIIYNKVTTTVDDGQSPSTYLGGRDIFQRRTTTFVNSELGFGGTQHSESLSCEYGHFYADNKRGQLIQIPSGGGSMIEISTLNSQGESTNMKDWFKRHLPFKIVNSNIEGIRDLRTDNSYNGIGMTFGFDALHSRVLITKKDYLPISDCKISYIKDRGFVTDNCIPPSPQCKKGFSYNAVTGMCEKITSTPLCPEGFIYNAGNGLCEPINPNPQPINYNGGDVVFIIDNFPNYGENLTNAKNAIINSLNSIEARFNGNCRFAVVTITNGAGSRKKYANLVPFTTNKTLVANAVTGISVINQNVFGTYYDPFDLAIEASILNLPERALDNSFIANSNTIGEFRTGSDIGKAIYMFGFFQQPAGLRIDGDGSLPSHYAFNAGGSQEGYEYGLYLKGLLQDKNIDFFGFDNNIVEGLEVQPSPSNGYHGSHTYYIKEIVGSTRCFHHKFSYKGVNNQPDLLTSLNHIGFRVCENRPIRPECKCNIQGSNCICVETEFPDMTGNLIDISLDDERYFKDVSWTVAYYPKYGQFSSFYSYTPNYYVNHHRNFETGKNDESNSLWAHNVTNKSFGVFYGKFNPMEVEVIVKSQLGSYLGSVALLSEAKRFFNNEDFYMENNTTFNKSIIYNRKECSGMLHLDLIEGTTRYLSKYPIAVDEMSQRIPITKSESMFHYNYFKNRVIKDSNKPFIKNDENEMFFKLDNISFYQKRQLEKLNGDYFLNRLIFDKDSRFCLTIKLQKSLTNLDNM